jgi:hypothetical protein
MVISSSAKASGIPGSACLASMAAPISSCGLRRMMISALPPV